ncbi:SET domain-containing protein [Lojkania enalia]|uniref:SET domain-containing protein n=1 Tax=Lojkania enalia TaxID=147567 RepID=A0A9P4N0I9_9PLEO|nr:SET domain-containing protein [Didymosphaeria enalia]
MQILASSTFILLSSIGYFQHAGASGPLLDIQHLLRPESTSSSPTQHHPKHASNPKTSDKSYAPWAHKPHCIYPQTAPNKRERFCVHTYHRQYGPSISIIGKPEMATDLLPKLDEDPLSIFLTPTQASEYLTTPRKYDVRPIPGKGIGVIATQKIPQYSTFMFDQASIVVDLEPDEKKSAPEYGRLLHLAVGQLREPVVVRNLSTANDERGLRKRGAELEGDVMETNSFATKVEDAQTKALFPLVSRINHACNPNAFVMFSPSGVSIGIKAYHDILPGEEITISYLFLGLPTLRRHERLEKWGFKCTCPLCSASPNARFASDTRRIRIEEAEKEIIDLWRDGQIQAAIRVAEEAVELMKEEDLTPMLTDEYMMLARLHMLRQEIEESEDYAAMTAEILKNLGFLGPEPDMGEWGLEKMLEAYGEGVIYRA